MRYVYITLISLVLSASAIAGEFDHKSHASSNRARGYSGHHGSHSAIGSGFGWQLGYSSKHGFDSGAFISFVFGAPIITHHLVSYNSSAIGTYRHGDYFYYKPDCYIGSGYYRDSYYGRSILFHDRHDYRSSYPYLSRYSYRYDDRYSYKRHTNAYPYRYDGKYDSTRYYHSNDWNRTGTRPLNRTRDERRYYDKIDSSKDRSVIEIQRRVDRSRAERDRAFDRLLRNDRTRIRVDSASNRTQPDRSRLDRATIRYQSDGARFQNSGDRRRVIFDNSRTRSSYSGNVAIRSFDAGTRSSISIGSRSGIGIGTRSNIGTRSSGFSGSRSSIGSRSSSFGSSRMGSRR